VPPNSILAENKQSRSRVSIRWVKRRADRILEVLGCRDCQLSMVLVDDRLMAELNEKYRDARGPTDVLSFPQGPPEFEEAEYRLLGDLVISTESAERQGEERGHSLKEEMDILITHGILHLLGYDHETTRSEEDKMKAREAEVFETLKQS
jgi:probable rRNA maturation factor